jgi:hypothetical protein
VAEQMTHEETKATMLSIAAGYQRMAEQAEECEAMLRELKAKPARLEDF